MAGQPMDLDKALQERLEKLGLAPNSKSPSRGEPQTPPHGHRSPADALSPKKSPDYTDRRPRDALDIALQQRIAGVVKKNKPGTGPTKAPVDQSDEVGRALTAKIAELNQQMSKQRFMEKVARVAPKQQQQQQQQQQPAPNPGQSLTGGTFESGGGGYPGGAMPMAY